MDDKVKVTEYKVKDYENLDAAKKENVLNEVKDISGVFDAKFDDETSSIKYLTDKSCGDYEIFCDLLKILDNNGIDLIFDEEINDEEVSDVNVNEDESEAENADDSNGKKDKKAEKIENLVILSLSAILTVLGFIFEKTNANASMWIYMFGFAFAGYETLYSLITDIAEKRYVGEKVMVLLSSFALLYFGFRLYGCAIVFSCSLLSCLYSVFGNVDEKLKEVGFSEENLSEERKKFEVGGKKLFVYDMILLAASVLLVFVPPFFDIKNYWSTLTQKWLPIGGGLISFGVLGYEICSLAKCRLFAKLNCGLSGVKIEDMSLLDSLAEVNKVCFDKTGVITKDKLNVVGVNTDDEEKLCGYILAAEDGLPDPTAKTLISYFEGLGTKSAADDKHYIEGRGVCFSSNGKNIIVGSRKLLDKNGVKTEDENVGNSIVYVVENGKIIGKVFLEFSVKDDAFGAVTELREDLQIESELLSADSKTVIDGLTREIGFKTAVSGASVEYKTERINSEKTLYAGNACADAEVLNRAKLSVAIGDSEGKYKISYRGTELKVVPQMLKTAVRMAKICKQNKLIWILSKIFFYALGVVLSLALGYRYAMFWAVAGATLCDIAIFLNSCRNLTEAV